MRRLLALLSAGAFIATGVSGVAAAAPIAGQSGVQPARHQAPKQTPAPAPVTALMISKNEQRSLTLTWHNPGGRSVAHILIRRAVGNQPPVSASDGTLVAVTDGRRTTFTDRHLSPSTTYSYAVYTMDRHHSASAAVTVSGATSTTDSRTGLRGNLTDPDGTPIVGAWVEIRLAGSGGWAGRVTTGHGGTFVATNLAPGSYQVCFAPFQFTTGSSPTGYLPGCYRQQAWAWSNSGTPVTVTDGKITPDISDTLPRAGAISGRITDSAGRGIAGVDVSIVSPPPNDYYSYGATTGADGSYLLKGLEAVDYQLCFDTFNASGASTTGYVAECYDKQPLYYRGTPIPVTLGSVHTGIDASLATGAAIVAHVTDDTGAPAANVRLELNPNVGYDSIGDQSTDQNGDLSATGIPAGNYGACFDGSFSSSSTAPYGYVGDCDNPQNGSFDLVAGKTVTLSAVVHAAGAIGGTVSGTDGPLDGVMVYVLDANGYEVNGTDTWDGGKWQLQGFTPGQYTVCYDPSWSGGGYLRGCYTADGTASSTGTPVQISAGQLTTVNTTLAQGASISGTVTDDAGVPLSSVEVTAYPLDGGDWAYGQTDENGNYTLSGVTPGHYAVCFDTSWAEGPAPGGYLGECNENKPDMESADPVEVGDTGTVTVDAALAAGAAISGRVTDEAGNPLEDVRVQGYSGSVSAGAYTDQDGKYLLRGLTTGDASVCFDPSWVLEGSSSTGYVAECYDNQQGNWGGTPVPVTEGQVTSGIDAQIAAGAAISGTVRDSSGAGLSNVSVTVTGMYSYFETDASTDQYGRYTVAGLPTGTYSACFAEWQWNTNYVPQCYDGAPDQTSANPITVSSGSTVSGIDVTLQQAAG